MLKDNSEDKYIAFAVIIIVLVSLVVFFIVTGQTKPNVVNIRTNGIIAYANEENKAGAKIPTDFQFYKDYVIITWPVLAYKNKKFALKTSKQIGIKLNNAIFIKGFPDPNKSYIFSFHYNDGFLDIKFFEDDAASILFGENPTFIIFTTIGNPKSALNKYNEVMRLYDFK